MQQVNPFIKSTLNIFNCGGDIGLKLVLGGIDWEVPTLLLTQQNNLAS